MPKQNDELPWFPCNPRKLLHAFSGMKPDEGYLYWIICLRIYEERAPIFDSVESLSRRSGFRPAHTAKLLTTLTTPKEEGGLGKLYRNPEGGLMNPFADGEIKDAASRLLKLHVAEKSPRKTQRKQGGESTHIQEQEHITKESKPKRRLPRSEIPADWKPSPDDLQTAAEFGFTDPGAIANMVFRFVNYHRAKGNLYARWSASWRIWCSNQRKFKEERDAKNGAYGNATATGGSAARYTRDDAIIAGMGELAHEIGRPRREPDRSAEILPLRRPNAK